MIIRHRFWILLAAAPLLGAMAGCGSTPQAALDQANHGAALTAALDAELKALRTAQASVAQSRLNSIRRLNTSVAQYARVRHQNADFAFLVKPLPCESTTYAHFCGSFVVATA